jgi:predicted enzyme related to lactoylglutathione lyase
MNEYQDVYKTAGAFSWTELMTPDPQAAQAFYGPLFGWKFDTMDMGTGPYHVAKVGETAIGGIMKTPPDAQGMPPMWGAYVTVADADATAAKCRELGGKVLAGPMDVPTVGRFVVMADPQGASIMAMQYRSG